MNIFCGAVCLLLDYSSHLDLALRTPKKLALFGRFFQFILHCIGRCYFSGIEMTTIPHHDPEKPQMLDMAKLWMDQCWRRKEITDSVYLRSLFIHGYSPADAVTELNLLKMERWK